MTAKPYTVTTDDKLNPDLADEVSSLRGGMLAQVPQAPEGFTIVPRTDRPAIDITRVETGVTTTVSLCDARGTVKALRELFGEGS